MTSYSVIITPRAQKDLDNFQGKQLLKFESAIMGLHDNPRPQWTRLPIFWPGELCEPAPEGPGITVCFPDSFTGEYTIPVKAEL